MEGEPLKALRTEVRKHLASHALTQEVFASRTKGIVTRHQIMALLNGQSSKVDVTMLVGLARAMELSTVELLAKIGLEDGLDLDACLRLLKSFYNATPEGDKASLIKYITDYLTGSE